MVEVTIGMIALFAILCVVWMMSIYGILMAKYKMMRKSFWFCVLIFLLDCWALYELLIHRIAMQ